MKIPKRLIWQENHKGWFCKRSKNWKRCNRRGCL